MKPIFKKAGLAVALGATALTAAAMPAEAQRYHHYRGNGDTAVVAGIAGLAIGAALASNGRYDRHYDYDRRYYRYHGYYPVDGYYYREHYRPAYYDDCRVRERWDPYLHRRVLIRYCD